jgi:ribA/ribD-fused uncharacterized protein
MPERTILDYPVQNVVQTSYHIMWIFSGEFSILDNFALTPVEVDIGYGLHRYATSEHAFAAAKAANRHTHNIIMGKPSPGAAKAIGRRVLLRADWEEVKFDVMWKVLVAKFDQHPEAVEILLSTSDRPIYEGNTWNDEVWGVTETRPRQWRGRNALGEMLMELCTLYNQKGTTV